MKKVLAFLLIFSSCGGVEVVEEASITTSSSTTTSTSSTTTSTSSTTTSTSSTTTSTSSTTTTTKLFNPGIEITNCPNSVQVNQRVEFMYTVAASGSDIEEISTYYSWPDGKSSVNIYNISDFDLPKKGTTLSTTSSITPTGGSSNWELFFHISVRNKQGQLSSAICRVNVIVNSSSNDYSDTTTTTIQNSSNPTTPTTTTPDTTTTTTTTTTTIPPVTYPSTPSTSTWSTFTGSGDSVLDITSVGTDVMIAQVSHSGSSNFSIVLRDSVLGYQGLKVNTIGSYTGIIPINFENEVNSNLEISADGNWEIKIKPIASSANFDGNSISGNGDTVIEAYELKSVDSLTISHSGSSNFSIVQYRCNGSYNGLLVNTIGSYSGSNITDSGTCFLEINADGSWSISK
jgi:hypothetical protein